MGTHFMETLTGWGEPGSRRWGLGHGDGLGTETISCHRAALSSGHRSVNCPPLFPLPRGYTGHLCVKSPPIGQPLYEVTSQHDPLPNRPQDETHGKAGKLKLS